MLQIVRVDTLRSQGKWLAFIGSNRNPEQIPNQRDQARQKRWAVEGRRKNRDISRTPNGPSSRI